MTTLPEEIKRNPVPSHCCLPKYIAHFGNAYKEYRLDVTHAALKDDNFQVSLIYNNFCRDEKGDRETVLHSHPASLFCTHHLMPFNKNRVIFLTGFEDVLKKHSHLTSNSFCSSDLPKRKSMDSKMLATPKAY